MESKVMSIPKFRPLCKLLHKYAPEREPQP
jgi:hypothetical protein